MEGLPHSAQVQIEKWQSAAFEQMYGFCPLDLYSGDRARMMVALGGIYNVSTADVSRVTPKLFRLTHPRPSPKSEDIRRRECHPRRAVDAAVQRIGRRAFPHPGSKPDFATDIHLRRKCGRRPSAITPFTALQIACILAGITDDSIEDFQLQEGSVLADLLKAQQIDTIGIVRAHEYYCMLPANIQRELKNKSNLLNRKSGQLHFLHRSDPRSLLERYLLAATMKDCSLMLSFRLVDPREGVAGAYEGSDGSASSNDRHRAQPIRIKAAAGSGYLYFAHSIRIVDLDPKTAKNLENAYHRFIAGVKVIADNPHIHKPCRI